MLSCFLNSTSSISTETQVKIDIELICTKQVHDTRPPSARPNFTDLSAVEKYTLPTSTYESLPNSVLAWKKAQKLGRFDPNAQSPEELMRAQAEKDEAEVKKKGELLPPSPFLPVPLYFLSSFY